MMSAANFVFLITIAGALFLAMRGLRSQGLSFRSKTGMAVAWAVIIIVLAFVFGRLNA